MFIIEGQSSIIYELIIILFHLQMMPILYFTYSIVYSPTRGSVSHCVNHSAYHSTFIIIMLIIMYMNIQFYYYVHDSNVAFSVTAEMQLIQRGLINE